MTPNIDSTASKAFHIYDFGHEQSQVYADASKVAESWKTLGVSNVAHIHAWVSDVRPKESWLDTLQERYVTAWAMTRPPPNWHLQRRDLFANCAARSLGTDHELALNRAKVESMNIVEELKESAHLQVQKEDEEEVDRSTAMRFEKQRTAVSQLFEKVVEISDMIRLVRGRMGQFLGA